MDETIILRTDDEAKNLIKQYLAGIDVEIVREMEKEGNWGFWIKFGDFPVLIDHRKGTHFCIVAFQVTLKDDHAISHLNEFYEKNDAQFMYEVTRAFTSPLTAYSRIIEQGKVIGFCVSKHIYPYHPDFNMRTLDTALQAVISTGAIGAAFLKWVTQVLEVFHERGIEPKYRDPTKLFE